MITQKSIKNSIAVENAPNPPPSLPANVVTPPAVLHVHADPPIGLRTVASFEFAKGILFLLFGLGALSFVHRDVAVAADNILKHFHLDPAWHYSKKFVQKVSAVSPSQFRFYGIMALILAAIRVVEGYCLWHEMSWAEWFAVISSSIYLPIEIYKFCKDPDIMVAMIFLVNLAIVIYLGTLLRNNYRRRALPNPLADPLK